MRDEPSARRPVDRIPWSRHLDLPAIALLAIGIRLAHLLAVWDDPFVRQPILDARYYLAFAARALQGEMFGVEVYRGSPLMGAFVALLRALFGTAPQIVMLAQVALGGATAVLVARIGTRVGGRLAGLVAGSVHALCWPAVLYTAVIAPATLAVFLATLALDQALAMHRAGALDTRPSSPTPRPTPMPSRTPTPLPTPPLSWRRLLLLGATLALAILARERNGLFALALIGFWMGRGADRRRVLVGLGGPLLAVLGLTTLNNGLACGDILPYSANGGINLYIGNGPAANGRFRPPPGFRRGRDQMYEDAAALASEAAGHPLSPGGVERYWYRETLHRITADPIGELRTLALKLSHMTGYQEGWDVVYGDAVRRESIPLRLCLFGMTLTGSLGWVGLWLARRRRGMSLVWLLVAAQVVFMLVFFASSRFRLGLLPALAIGAGLLAAEVSTPGAGLRRRIHLAVLAGITAAAILAPLPGREANPRMEATWHANRALSAIMRHAMDEAGSEARAALAIDPENVSALIYLGRVLLEQGALEEAEQRFLAATRLQPRDPRGFVSLGVVALDRGDRQGADRWFRAVLKVDPDNGKANFERAVFLLQHGDREGARRHALRIIDQPRYRERLRRLGLN